MNRLLAAIVLGAIVEMALVGVGALAWKGAQAGGLDAGHLQRSFPVNLILLPLVIAGVALAIRRRVSGRRPQLSAGHVHFLSIGLATVAVSAALVHGLLAYAFLTQAPLDKAAMLRLTVLLLGSFLAVRGNFFAKLDPPHGAPSSAVVRWTRGALGLGWLAVFVGVGLILGALALPDSKLIAALAAAAVALLVGELAFKRSVRTAR